MLLLRFKKKSKDMKKAKNRIIGRRLKSTAVLVIFGCTVLGVAPFVHADVFQQQIDTLNAQSNSAQQSLDQLQLQASSYQAAINQLQVQIADIEQAITTNQNKEASLEQQIANDEVQITQEKGVLAKNIKAQYADGQMSTIEMLATSQNINVYVDRQAYEQAVQNQIQQTLNQIAITEAQEQDQKNQVTQLLATEQVQQNQLSADQAQQNQLLAYNQSQQDQYNQQIASNAAQISTLRAEQAAANAAIARAASVAASGGSGGACDIGQGNGGYPMGLCNSAQDSINDAYGFPSRECTSYAYWYFVNQEGQSNFQVSGNAGWWWLTSNYPVSAWNDSVKDGALGIEPSSSLNAPVPSLHGGYYGHVMIVQNLPGENYKAGDGSIATVPNGYVLVKSMNEDEAGHFMYNLWPVSYLLFVNPQ